MKQPIRPPRTPSRLSDSIHHQLNMYALAASAAGVGALAMVQPAQAKIVYTPTHKNLPINKYFYLDLNHDSVNDFKFYVLAYCTAAGENCDGAVNLYRLRSVNGAVGQIRSNIPFNSALVAGAPVGNTQQFLNQAKEVMGWCFGRYSGGCYGPWATSRSGPVDHRYLGLKFKINGKTHYGWARLNVWVRWDTASATLTGYAYETIPGKAIVTGKTKGPDVITLPPDNPGSLGHLAQGRK